MDEVGFQTINGQKASRVPWKLQLKWQDMSYYTVTRHIALISGCVCKLLYLMKIFGEPARVRTVDLLIKSQLLYQLSYGLPKAGM